MCCTVSNNQLRIFEFIAIYQINWAETTYKKPEFNNSKSKPCHTLSSDIIFVTYLYGNNNLSLNLPVYVQAIEKSQGVCEPTFKC